MFARISISQSEIVIFQFDVAYFAPLHLHMFRIRPRYIGESKVGMETDAFAIADCMGSLGWQLWCGWQGFRGSGETTWQGCGVTGQVIVIYQKKGFSTHVQIYFWMLGFGTMDSNCLDLCNSFHRNLDHCFEKYAVIVLRLMRMLEISMVPIKMEKDELTNIVGEFVRLL